MDDLKECREAFEAWARSKERLFDFEGTKPNSAPWYYFDDEVQDAWETWQAARNRRAVPQANAELDARPFLQPDDLAALHRFMDFCTDSDAGGYSIPKERMQRLAEIGAIESKGFGRYQVTTFGLYVLTMDADGSANLPLKTYAEYDADSRAAHEAKIFGGAASNAANEVQL